MRKAGNDPAHNHADDHALALTTLKITRQLAIWFHKTLGNDSTFKARTFVPPAEPEDAEAKLRAELERLQRKLLKSQSAEERARHEACLFSNMDSLIHAAALS